MPNTIYIIEDHPVVRAGYASLIEREVDLELVGTAGSGQEALEDLFDLQPDLVLLDLSLPSMNGMEVLKHLLTQKESQRVLVISAHDEVLYAERTLRAGASGYIMKQNAVSVIVDAIRHVLRGEIYLSGALSEQFLHRYLGRSDDAPSSPFAHLSDRELEVFQLLGRGLTTREIAQKMIISPKTVETYRANLKQKLNIDSSAELTRRAVLWVAAQT